MRRVVNRQACVMVAGWDTVPTADTNVGIYQQFFFRAVHAVFDRTLRNAGVTINALFFIYPYYRSKQRFSHFFPTLFYLFPVITNTKLPPYRSLL